MKDDRVATIKDVADQAGVSIATVSRVMNGSGRVSDILSHRVRQAADALNYTPSRVAGSLRRQRTHSIGMVVPQLDQPFFSRLTFVIQRRLMLAGYQMLACSTLEQSDLETTTIDMLLQQRVDGVIIVPTGHGARSVQHLMNSDVPVVLVDRDLPDLGPMDRVLVDNRNGAYKATQHLIESGHRDIGVISALSHIHPMHERVSGIRAAIADAGLGWQEALHMRAQRLHFDEGYGGAMTLLQKSPRPTAIFALTDVIAVGVLHAAYDFGLHLPHGLSVVGFDGIPLAAYSRPTLTTVAQPVQKLGVAAVELLLQRLNPETHNMPPQTIVLDAELVKRASVTPLKAAPAPA